MLMGVLSYSFTTFQSEPAYGMAMLGPAPAPHDQSVIDANLQVARDSTGQASNLNPGYTTVGYSEFDFNMQLP